MNNEHDKYQNVFITDISIDNDLANKIEIFTNNDNDVVNFGKYVLLDHHATALELNKYSWCSVKIENDDGIKTSGTELFYDYLKANISVNVFDYYIKKFVQVVRDYDTWRWATSENGTVCKQVNDLLYMYGRENFIIWAMAQIYDEKFLRFDDRDCALLNNKQKEINDYISMKNEQMYIGKYYGYDVGVVFADRFTSELGNKLCEMHSEIDFIVMINISDCTVSYRTVKDNIDLGKDIATKNGGGGHPKAAGSQFPKSIQLDVIMKILYEVEINDESN